MLQTDANRHLLQRLKFAMDDIPESSPNHDKGQMWFLLRDAAAAILNLGHERNEYRTSMRELITAAKKLHDLAQA